MFTYRIVLDAYNSMSATAKSARVVTYAYGRNRADAMRRINVVNIGQDGTVSDGINTWPGNRNLPAGNVQARHLPEWSVVSMRSVKTAGTARILAE